ncbi:MAG: ABC transporter permease [Lachnospiraceae bacterium]|nr:ABC transporter permease [Lachnospiraceae bacterium]
MWIKNLRYRKTQTCLLFVIVLLCTLLLCSSLTILLSMNEPFQKLVDECNTGTAMFYSVFRDKETVTQIQAEFEKLDNVKQTILYKYHYVEDGLKVKGKAVGGFYCLTPYVEGAFKKIRYLEGDALLARSLKDSECIIPSCMAIGNDVRVGDEISVQMGEEVLHYTVRGIFVEPYSSSTSYDSSLLVKEIPEQMSLQYKIRLYGKEGTTGQDIENAYRKSHEGQMPGQLLTVEDAVTNTTLANNIMASILIVVGLIMLIVSLSIINFMIRNTMIQDAKTIAMYKVIGYTKADILSNYLTFYFVVMSVASLFAMIGSKIFASKVLESMFETIGEKSNTSVLLPGVLCYVIIVGFATLLIRVIINKSQKANPIYALNNWSNTNSKKKLKGNMKVRFSPFGIAIRNLLRDKKGATGILITSLITIFGVNFAIISLDVALHMRENNDYWLAIENSDIRVTVNEGVDFEEVRRIVEQNDMVDRVIANASPVCGSLKWTKDSTFTLIYPYVYETYEDCGQDAIEGRNPIRGNEVSISGKVAKERNKTVGDYIEIELNGKKINFLITGIYQTYLNMGKSCRLIEQAYTENGLDFTFTNLGIYANKTQSVEDTLNKLKADLDGKGKVMYRSETNSEIMDMIAGPQTSSIPAITILVLLIGTANIFCIVLLRNANSEKMNGIYKCIGYSTRHLIIANVTYVMILAVLSILIAVPLILYLYPKIMTLSLSMFGLLRYDISYNYLEIFVTNGVVLLMFIFGTIVSSRSLKKINVRDLVQE